MNESTSSRRDESTPTLKGNGEVRAGRFSVARLSSAFSRLMGATSVDPNAKARLPATGEGTDPHRWPQEETPLRVTPELIVEGALFVGRPDGAPIKSSEIADHIRDVDPAEVESIIRRLNEKLDHHQAAYRIERAGAGFCLRLRPELRVLGKRFQGLVRAAKLSPLALEVLSIVAYRQPITGAAVNKVRGARSHAILSQLVRRRLLSIEKNAPESSALQYRTTERFDRLFGVRSPAELPRSEDLDDS